MADEHFYGIPKAQQAYEPIGDLLLSFGDVDNAQEYRRELDMEAGVAKVAVFCQPALSPWFILTRSVQPLRG